jgi:hypothetical protein
VQTHRTGVVRHMGLMCADKPVGPATIGLPPECRTRGADMNKILMDDDGLAVDLLLDRTSMNSDNTAGFLPPNGDSVIRRIGAVETILRLFAETPAGDPPAGLAQRTLDHIQRHGHKSVSRPLAEPTAPAIGQGPHHA